MAVKITRDDIPGTIGQRTYILGDGTRCRFCGNPLRNDGLNCPVAAGPCLHDGSPAKDTSNSHEDSTFSSFLSSFLIGLVAGLPVGVIIAVLLSVL